MTYRVSWDIDIDEATSPLEAAHKAHAIIHRPGTPDTVYNVEAPDGTVTAVDLKAVDGLPVASHASLQHQALELAERFVSGFEGDQSQEGIDQLLAVMRSAMQGRTDRRIVDETNALARYIMAELIGTGYQVPDGWEFHEATDPRGRKAWTHAVVIMEMITFTSAEDALSNLDPDEAGPKGGLPLEDWQHEVANGDTRLGYQAWLEAKRPEDVSPVRADAR